MRKYDWQKRQDRYFEKRNKENGFLFTFGLIGLSFFYVLCYFLACFWQSFNSGGLRAANVEGLKI